MAKLTALSTALTSFDGDELIYADDDPSGTPADRKMALSAWLAKSNYYQKILRTYPADLIGYWPMWDLSGTTAQDLGGNVGHGVYKNTTLDQAGVGDGNRSVSMNGSTSNISLYSANLSVAWNPDLFTVAQWVKPYSSAFWTDGAVHDLCVLFSPNSTSNTFGLKSATNGRLQVSRLAAGVTKTITIDSQSWTAWTHVAWTFSLTDDRLRVYINGVLTGTPATGNSASDDAGLNQYSSNFGSGFSALPIHVYQGNVAHVAIWKRELTAAELLYLATV